VGSNPTLSAICSHQRAVTSLLGLFLEAHTSKADKLGRLSYRALSLRKRVREEFESLVLESGSSAPASLLPRLRDM
jgi:hypothetical protein